ncbi:hypothetical protein [Streptomyces sp. NPDC003327]
MKFTDGFWLMREGVHASYATRPDGHGRDGDRDGHGTAVRG